MAAYECEPVTLLGVDGPPFEGVRRDYALEVKKPKERPGETIFSALGEYAIHQPDNDMWQLLPEEQWAAVQHAGIENYPSQWATAEDLRTRAGEGTFLPEHMDSIDMTLFRDQRKTKDTTRLTVASEADLRALLADHNISTDHWTASVRRLYNDIKPVEPTEEKENISLHLVDGVLWLSTAQTMVNVYHTDKDGQTYKLKETDIIYYDDQENPQPAKPSKLRSSLGETGHITGNRPERPYITALRGLYEELGLYGNDIARLVSLDSILRLKDEEAGHHSFGPEIKAEDRTHYFRADLNPEAVRPKYINKEYDAQRRLTALITLEWIIPPEYS